MRAQSPVGGHEGLELRAVWRGVMAGYVFSLAASLVLAIIVFRTVLAPGTVALLTSVTSGLAVFVAGLYAGRCAGRSGWIHGSAAGALFVMTALVVSLMAFPQIPSAWLTAERLAAGFVLGLAGGVMGVNL